MMYLYWIRKPEHTNPLKDGYIGISSDYKEKNAGEDSGVSKIVVCVELGRVFYSIREACVFVNGKPNGGSNIINVCKNLSKSAYGYTWKYAQRVDMLRNM